MAVPGGVAEIVNHPNTGPGRDGYAQEDIITSDGFDFAADATYLRRCMADDAKRGGWEADVMRTKIEAAAVHSEQMAAVTGDKVRVVISNLDHWQKQVAECLNGATGTVEAISECSYNGCPCGSRALLVKLDRRVFPNHPSACYSMGFESFWFAPCNLTKKG